MRLIYTLITLLLLTFQPSLAVAQPNPDCPTIAETAARVPNVKPQYIYEPELSHLMGEFIKHYRSLGHSPSVPEMDSGAAFVGDEAVLLLVMKDKCIVGKALMPKEDFFKFMHSSGRGVQFRG